MNCKTTAPKWEKENVEKEKSFQPGLKLNMLLENYYFRQFSKKSQRLTLLHYNFTLIKQARMVVFSREVKLAYFTKRSTLMWLSKNTTFQLSENFNINLCSSNIEPRKKSAEIRQLQQLLFT